MNWLLVLMCWVMGIVGAEDGHCDRIRARARCREIRVRQQEVVVKFTCREDAELFARDLADFVRD